MKRTREAIYYSHPAERWNLSGCTYFDGEDAGKAQRVAMQNAEQKAALQQQIAEKNAQRALEKRQDE